jgi:hypothetical protein
VAHQRHRVQRFVDRDDNEQRDRDQDQDDGRGGEQRGAERPAAAHARDRLLVQRRQDARQHRGDQQRPPERPDDGDDERRGRADQDRLRLAPCDRLSHTTT